MHARSVDVAVIGAGSAGMVAFRAARKHTDSVLLIEGGEYGTTCARVGCMPSKLLIAAADAAHAVQDADGFGLRTGPLIVDGAAVMARVRAERDRFVGFVTETIDSWPADHQMRAKAHFLEPNVLALDNGLTIHAKRVVIATGSRPRIIDDWRLRLGDKLIINDDVFDWGDLPESVAVVGAGIIGVELGLALHRLGVRVRVFDRGGGFGPLSDPVVTRAAREHLAAAMPLATGAQINEVDLHQNQVRIRYQYQNDSHSECFDRLLLCIGRLPNVEALQLQNAQLPLDPRGVPISNAHTGQIGESTVFIAGDVASRRMLLHEAADEGRLAGDNAGRYPDVREHPRRTPLGIAFSDPQMAVVGVGHEELLRRQCQFATGAVDFGAQGRSRVMRRNRGLLHVYAEVGSGRFLGAEMIAPAGEHLAHLLAWACHADLSVDDMLAAPFYHPVIEEGVRTALRDLAHRLRMGPAPVPHCMDCGPGA